jgi:hypothetical protein
VFEKSNFLGQFSQLQLKWSRAVLVGYLQACKRGPENEDCFRHVVAIACASFLLEV